MTGEPACMTIEEATTNAGPTDDRKEDGLLSQAQTELLRSMSIGDDATIRSALAEPTDLGLAIDRRTAALVRMAAVIVLDASLPAYQREVQAALDAGATVDEILSLLLVLAGPIGSFAMIAAAPKIAMALGYDVEAGLERLSA